MLSVCMCVYACFMSLEYITICIVCSTNYSVSALKLHYKKAFLFTFIKASCHEVVIF